jgi:ABC-type uncharacterized transport system permease subunit
MPLRETYSLSHCFVIEHVSLQVLMARIFSLKMLIIKHSHIANISSKDWPRMYIAKVHESDERKNHKSVANLDCYRISFRRLTALALSATDKSLQTIKLRHCLEVGGGQKCVITVRHTLSSWQEMELKFSLVFINLIERPEPCSL